AVLLPGTASTADLVHRMFSSPLAAHGYALVTTDPPGCGGLVRRQLAALDDAVTRFAPRLVGGVSLGAHLAARWALSRGPVRSLDGLLLAMPAWTGPPGRVAAASGAAAEEVARHGLAATVARIEGAAAGWVADEIAAAWLRYDEAELVAALHATAAAPAPTLADLARVDVPCGLAGLLDDPLHPAAVARRWARALPRAVLVETTLAAVGTDRSAVGHAALLGWHQAVERPAGRPAAERQGP
ncbi:MAG TPA: hypothetical protein VGR21_08740, partial [Cryptosporangiaceae bacterium]|nr:hypothetical protein [Cryptosporangiaceae bacterium]